MKLLAVLALAAVTVTASLRAEPPVQSSCGPACAFADERFMTITNVCVLAAEHYLAHHRWPRNRAELQTQALKENTRREAGDFFARFSRLDLLLQGADLRLEMRFRTAGRTHRQSIVLHPGESAEDILQAATEPPAA